MILSVKKTKYLEIIILIFKEIYKKNGINDCNKILCMVHIKINSGEFYRKMGRLS